MLEHAARHAVVRCLGERDAAWSAPIQRQQRSPRQRHQDGRVRGHHHLRLAGASEPIEQHQQRQLPLRGERRLGFVEQEESRAQPAAEHVEEGLAMRAFMQAATAVLLVGIAQEVGIDLALVEQVGEAHQALGAKEPGVSRASQERWPQGACERRAGPRVLRACRLLPTAALGRHAEQHGQSLQQRGLPRAVLPHQDRHGGGELEVEVAHAREVEGVHHRDGHPFRQQPDAIQVGDLVHHAVSIARQVRAQEQSAPDLAPAR